MYQYSPIGHYFAQDAGQGFRLQAANPAFCRILGIPLNKALDRLLAELWPDGGDIRLAQLARRAVQSGQLVVFEHKFVVADGSRIFRHKLIPVQAPGQDWQLMGVLHDITEQQHRERIILRIQRMYELLSQINQMIVRCDTKDTLLQHSCDIAVDTGKLRMAWIGLVDENINQVAPYCWAGHNDGYLKKMVRISTEEIGTGRGPTGSAIREGRHVICQDVANDATFRPWREDALKRGYRSTIALPLREDNKVIGSFNLYADEAFFFDPEEVRLLDELATDISFALQILYNEERRHHSEERLVQQERKHSRDWQLLTQATRQINTNLSLPEIIRALVASAIELTGAEQGTAGTMQGGKMVFTEITVKGQVAALDYSFEEGYGVPGWVIQHCKPYMTNDCANDPNVVEEIRQKLQFNNLLDVPILGSDDVLLGCFEIHNKKGGFDDYDITLLQTLAAATAIAIQNAEIISKLRKSC